MPKSTGKRFVCPRRWPLAKRLAQYTAAPNERGCTLWVGKSMSNGRGMMRWNRTLHMASRLAWIAARGPIPTGMCICHQCDTPACINIEHLFLGTQSDNIADMMSKGRGPCGVASGHAKLTDEQVHAIRADTRINTVIAADYGISFQQVSRIKRRQRWAHLLENTALFAGH